MTSPRDHDEIRDLLAVWALDAVDDDERAVVDEHLATCPVCRAEAEAHQSVAAALGNTSEEVPPGLWDRIATSLDDTPPPLRLEPRRPVRARVVTALVAAAVVLIAGLGYQLVDQQRRIDQLQVALQEDALAQAASMALADPNARRSVLRSPDGQIELIAVVDPNGAGYLLASGLPALPEGRTYQLWGVAPDAVVSLGVLGAEPSLVAFRMTGDVDALAVTDEAAPGVPVSEQEPVAVGEVEQA